MRFDEVKIIYGFPDGKTVVTYNINGKKVIVGGSNGVGTKVYETNVDDQEYINTELNEHIDSVTCVAASREGAFATGGEDGIVALYTANHVFEKMLVRSAVPIRDISFHPNGSKLAIATDENIIRIVFTADNSNIIQLEGHVCPVKSVDYHPTGNYLLSSDINGNIKIWDVSSPTPTCIKTLPEFCYKSDIDSILQSTVAWSPDESCFAFPGTSKNVRIFRGDVWTPSYSLDGQHRGNVITLAWSPNGYYLASSADDNSVIIWDMKKKKPVYNEITSAQITGIAWNPIENEITLTDIYGQIRIWKDVIPIDLDDHPHPAIYQDTISASQQVLQQDFHTIKAEKEPPVSQPRFDDEDADMLEELGEDIDRLDMNDNTMDEERPQTIKVQSEIQPVVQTNASLEKAQKRLMVALDPPVSFQPGETPYHPPGPGVSFAPLQGEKRYMTFNAVGAISTTFDGEQSTIRVEFHDPSEFANYEFTDTMNYSVATLTTMGAAFGVEGKESKTRKIVGEEGEEEEEEELVQVNSSVYYTSNARNEEWTHTLLPGEDVVCLAANRMSVIATTSLGYVRIFSISGVQRHLFSIENVVSVCAITDLALIVYAKSPSFQGQQNLHYILMNTDTADVLQKDKIQLTADSELIWIGFSETNQAATYDSAGILRVLEYQRRPFQAHWVPVFNGKAYAKSVQRTERYWPVGLLRDRFLCIVLRGSNGYPFFPIPPIVDVPLQVPLLAPDTEAGQLEEEVIRIDTTNRHERDEAEATNTGEACAQAFDEADVEMDVALLKLINLACKSEKLSRAIDLTYSLHSEESIDKAIKIASFHQFSGLASKMMSIKEEKFSRQMKSRSTLADALEALPAIYASLEPPFSSPLAFVRKQEDMFHHRKKQRLSRIEMREKPIPVHQDDDFDLLATQANSKRAKPFKFSSS